MAKRTKRAKDGPLLYEHHAQAHQRRIRRQRALLIPRYLTEAAAHQQLAGAPRDRAHEIAVRWADLETSGALPDHAETTIDSQYLNQFFCEGLGYSVKTISPAGWDLEHQFTVPGVGTADGAIGDFPTASIPTAVIELKGAAVDLDRDRSNGRTAVQQLWDYLVALPGCPWGILSNFSTIRLYHRDKGPLAYEEFTLQELRDPARFREFYCIFERGGLLPSRLLQRPRALDLLLRTERRQKEVGDELYKSYQFQRLRLIDHLIREHAKPFDTAIRIAQRLLDRIIFIAFCEDRGLLPDRLIASTHADVSPISRATNPRWRNFLRLFTAVDKGVPAASGRREITAFNGGLFAHDDDVDTLDLDDEPWTDGFKGFGDYDFSEEVNVEVLGHLFERSITELEKLRIGGRSALLAGIENGHANGTPVSRMPKSAQRKRFGIYYTPPAFTSLIVERTVDAAVAERFAALRQRHRADPESPREQDPERLRAYWRDCLEALKGVTVCDPACGSGAFLIRAYDALDAHYKTVIHGLAGAGEDEAELARLEDTVPDLILTHNLFGVDLSEEAVEITQLALWIRSARRGRSLADLSRNIHCGNSLVSDPAVHPRAFNWRAAFPSIFPNEPRPSGSGSSGFTCVIGNPPWERIKLQEREFFSLTDPEIAEAVSAADRRRRIASLPQRNPELHAAYLDALDKAQRTLDDARGSGRFPLTGKGDVNLYMLFAELASTIVAPDGLAGLLVPSGIATDDSTKAFFNDLMDRKALISLYDFENKQGHFPDVHRSFKFSALVFGGANRRVGQADFVFFAHSVEEAAESSRQRHIPLTAADMALFNPNTRTCPIFRTRRDAELTRAVYARIPVLFDRNRRQGGNPWGIRFFTMFHQTNDAELFHPASHWKKKGYALSGNVFARKRARALPLYEAKMVQAFDHRAASVLVEKGNWVRQGQKAETTPVQHQNPEFAVMPRWWVAEDAVNERLGGDLRPAYLCYKDVTSPTNERTMIASFIPRAGVVNSAPLMLTDSAIEPRRVCCLLANLNSFAYDFIARQKVGGVHLNFFIVEQLPTLPPDAYAEKCPWSRRETLEHWISERVLRLTCTAEDMIPLAQACGFTGSNGSGVHKWKDAERARLRAELDAAYFHLYALSRDDAEYALTTFTGTGHNPQARPSEPSWTPAAAGHAILDAYDALPGQ
ncbi:MAG: hypothetical protein KIS87_05265 [Phycisphaeraceae bacterium]|nr:hypothetical protein [Phycisphaeraceae bacterium]